MDFKDGDIVQMSEAGLLYFEDDDWQLNNWKDKQFPVRKLNHATDLVVVRSELPFHYLPANPAWFALVHQFEWEWVNGF